MVYIHTLDIAYCTFSLQTCTVVSPTELLCMIPELTTVTRGCLILLPLDYSLTFDGQVLPNLSSIQCLLAVTDPEFSHIHPTRYAENCHYCILTLFISVSVPGLCSCEK